MVKLGNEVYKNLSSIDQFTSLLMYPVNIEPSTTGLLLSPLQHMLGNKALTSMPSPLEQKLVFYPRIKHLCSY